MVSAIMQGGSPCENAPGLRVGAFNVEFAAMMAPRPMLLVSATGDWTKNAPKDEFPAIRGIYSLYGAGDSVEGVQFDAPHNYNQDSREAVYGFFGRHVLGQTEAQKPREREIRVEKLQDMLVFHARALPANALSYEALFEQWKRSAARQAAEVRPPSTVREMLGLAIGAEWPAKVIHELEGDRIVLSREERGDRVPGLWSSGRGDPVLIVHPEGAQAARRSPAAQKYLQAGRPILSIDAFQTGSAVAPRDRSHRHFLTFNRTDDAHRAQDILTALAFLHAREKGVIELVGLEKAAVWSVFAAVLSPIRVRLSADLGGFSGSDEDFIRDFFVPGIQRAGGLKAALALTAGMR